MVLMHEIRHTGPGGNERDSSGDYVTKNNAYQLYKKNDWNFKE